jgi:hypothetical protein
VSRDDARRSERSHSVAPRLLGGRLRGAIRGERLPDGAVLRGQIIELSDASQRQWQHEDAIVLVR